MLDGGEGVDVLQGGNGNDTLIGGEGNDYHYGGAGRDVFEINARNMVEFDRIQDFEDGFDLIRLVGFGFSDISDLTLTMPSAGRTVLDLGTGQKINLAGVDMADLSNADFLFV